MTILTKALSPKTAKILILYLLFLSVLELLAYNIGRMFSIAASHLWLVTALLCSLLLLVTAIRTFIADIRNRKLFLPVAFLLLLALFCAKIGTLGYSDISYEAALQVAAGLDSFQASDLNYTGVAFLDYANRQYVLNALPALLLGRSVFTLHLGFAYPFLMGMTLLYLELRTRLREENIREEYALLPLYALPVFPFITEYFMNFEQTLTPVAFTMLGLSLLLRFYRKRDIAGILSLSFVGGMCCNSYTPVLAFFGFLLVFLSLWGIRTMYSVRKSLTAPGHRALLWQILLCFSLVLQLLCYFFATLGTRQKDMITTLKPELSLITDTFTSWFDFFTDRHALFWGIWLFPVLLYLFFSLTGLLRLHHFLVAGWMLLTVFFSGTLAGYTTYAKAHEIQRNMLIIPVFVTAFFLAAACYFKLHPVRLPRFVLPLGLAALLLLGQFNFCREHHSFTYYRYIQSMKYMLAYTEELLDDAGLSNTDHFRLILLTDNSLLSNLSDYTSFFYTEAEVFVASPEEFTAGNLPESGSSLPTLIFCESLPLPGNNNYSIISQSFENKRYHSTITWYCLLPEQNTN